MQYIITDQGDTTDSYNSLLTIIDDSFLFKIFLQFPYGGIFHPIFWTLYKFIWKMRILVDVQILAWLAVLFSKFIKKLSPLQSNTGKPFPIQLKNPSQMYDMTWEYCFVFSFFLFHYDLYFSTPSPLMSCNPFCYYFCFWFKKRCRLEEKISAFFVNKVFIDTSFWQMVDGISKNRG